MYISQSLFPFYEYVLTKEDDTGFLIFVFSWVVVEFMVRMLFSSRFLVSVFLQAKK
jgi:lipid-A-disaccharide synthase-like uncharacterized protein